VSEQHSESALPPPREACPASGRTGAHQAPPLPADWRTRDSAGSYADAIAALRKRLGAGWQPPQGSPYRARPTRCAEDAL
jgi:hypothetical protein